MLSFTQITCPNTYSLHSLTLLSHPHLTHPCTAHAHIQVTDFGTSKMFGNPNPRTGEDGRGEQKEGGVGGGGGGGGGGDGGYDPQRIEKGHGENSYNQLAANSQVGSSRQLLRGASSNDMLSQCKLTTAQGTVHWSAPEMLVGTKTAHVGVGDATKIDVYSYGMVLWELVSPWDTPFSDLGLATFFGLRDAVRRGKRPPIPAWAGSGRFRQLIEACWHQNPSDRPTFKEIVTILQAEVTAWEQMAWQ